MGGLNLTLDEEELLLLSLLILLELMLVSLLFVPSIVLFFLLGIQIEFKTSQPPTIAR